MLQLFIKPNPAKYSADANFILALGFITPPRRNKFRVVVGGNEFSISGTDLN